MASSTLPPDLRGPQSINPRSTAPCRSALHLAPWGGLWLAILLAIPANAQAQPAALIVGPVHQTDLSSGRLNNHIQPTSTSPSRPSPRSTQPRTPTKEATATATQNNPSGATSPRTSTQPQQPQPRSNTPSAQPVQTTQPTQPAQPTQPQAPPQSGPAQNPPVPQTLTAPSQTGPKPAPQTSPQSQQKPPAPGQSPARPGIPPQYATSQNKVSRRETRDRFYDPYYRPAHNPIRPIFIARGGVALGGNSGTSDGGRGFLLEFEGGATMNKVGLSLAAGVQLGQFKQVPGSLIVNPNDPNAAPFLSPAHRTPATLSIGPRVSWGRMALFGSGYLDPRVGYDIRWTPVQKSYGVRPFKSVTTHGPTVRIDAGFVSQSNRQFWLRRVFGASLGWHMVAGNIKNKMPKQHFLTIGLFFNLN